MSESKLAAGTVLGEYILDAKIGRGATGEVWQAHHHVWTRRKMAIKLATNVEFQRSLQQEGILHDDLSRLDSPQLVKVFGLNIMHTPPYMVMELVDGEDLRERLKRDGKLSAEAARAILLDVAKGLDAAHSLGIVHRDLKPENVLLDRAGRAKLTDFSIAAAAPTQQSLQLSLQSDPESAPSLAGTLVYMSPEQRSGRGVTPRSDIYSAGLLLFEMVTGDIPQPGDRIRDLLPEAPSWLDAIFERCYCREDRRFASAKQLADALERWPDAPPQAQAAAPMAYEQASQTSGEPSTQVRRRRQTAISSRDLSLDEAAQSQSPGERKSSGPISTRSFEQLTARRGQGEQAPASGGEAAARAGHPGAPGKDDAPRPAGVADLEALLDSMPEPEATPEREEEPAVTAAQAAANPREEIRDPRPSRQYDEVLPTLEALYRRERVGPAMAAYSAGQFNHAEAEFRRVLDAHPGDSAALQGLAMTLYRRGNSKAALRLFRELLQANPDSAETWNNVGVVSLAAKRLREAERALLRAIELRPRYASAHANLSAVYQQQGRLDEARREAQIALEIDPTNDAASFNAGLT